MMKMRSLSLFLLGLSALGHAAEIVKPDPTENFVGLSWSEMRIGATTDAQIKKLYQLDKPAIRPEALRLKIAERDLKRVDVLLNGRGAKATVSGFYLQYEPGKGPEIATLGKAISKEPMVGFPANRYEDWSVAGFADRGIFALCQNIGGKQIAEIVLLLAPEAAEYALRGWEAEPTRIEKYDPVITFEDLLITYGRASGSVSGSNVEFSRREDIEDDIQYELERSGRSRFLQYDRRGNAQVSGSLNVGWDKKRKEVTYSVTVSASGTNLLGNVTASGSAERTFRRMEEKPRVRSERFIIDLIRDARDDMERNFDSAVSRQRPPTATEIRYREWMKIVNDATKN